MVQQLCSVLIRYQRVSHACARNITLHHIVIYVQTPIKKGEKSLDFRASFIKRSGN